MNRTGLEISSTIERMQLQTGSRLHCGLFSDHRPSGRRFQGFGIMVDQPGVRLRAEKIENSCSGFEVRLADPLHKLDGATKTWLRNRTERAWRILTADRKLTDRVRVTVFDAIPQHVGLGAGTQTALAIGEVWRQFCEPSLTTSELSQRLGRGQRSCIGTHGYERGGLLIDRGVTAEQNVGSCRFATALPDTWRIVLVTPRGIRGLAGQSEVTAFQNLPPLAGATLDRLAELLNIIQRSCGQFGLFSESLREFGLLVGESFSAIQGGRFVHPDCETVFAALTQLGVRGIAQSSWGPTLLAVCENQSQAQDVAEQIKATSGLDGITVRICQVSSGGTQLDLDPAS